MRFSSVSGFCKNVTPVWAFLVSLFVVQLMFCPAATSLPEYLYLEGTGSSMYPTIREGDRVKVKMRVDPASVSISDIIVYGSIAASAYVSQPQAIWICHRVIGKFEESGTWYFTTKGDNNSERDPWRVPAYWLLGIVVEIEHSNIPAKSSKANEEPLDISYFTDPSGVLPFREAIGLCLAIGAAAVLIKSMKKRRNEKLFENGLCYRCRRYEAEFCYTLLHSDGRLGLRRTLSSRGFCKYHNIAVFKGTPPSGCGHYEPLETVLDSSHQGLQRPRFSSSVDS